MVIENALSLSLNDLAEGLTHCFEGYIMPAHFTGALVASMVRLDAVDISSSLVGRDEQGILGIVLVARRGNISRIAAMAVAKSARRKGVGRELMLRAIEDAKARGEELVVLEVIEQNPAAIELYKQIGFETQHRLVGFEGQLEQSAEVSQPVLLGPQPKPAKKATKPKLKECSFSEVASALRQRGFLASSWSMSPATVEQLTIPSRAVKCGDVLAVVGLSGDEIVACRSLAFSKAPSREAVRSWISAMACEYTGKKLYIPAFFPEPEYGDAFVDSGLRVGEISQFQMALKL